MIAPENSPEHVVKVLSKTLNSPCLSVNIFDSDMTMMILCDADRNVEDMIYYGMDEALEEWAECGPGQWHGDRAKWEGVLKIPMNADEWEGMWTFNLEESPFAEDVLYLFGEKIGVPGEPLVCDYEMLSYLDLSGEDIIYLE